jgi:hypothetical protein
LLLSIFAGCLLLRMAERQLSGLLWNDPPRNTRDLSIGHPGEQRRTRLDLRTAAEDGLARSVRSNPPSTVHGRTSTPARVARITRHHEPMRARAPRSDQPRNVWAFFTARSWPPMTVVATATTHRSAWSQHRVSATAEEARARHNAATDPGEICCGRSMMDSPRG